MSRQHTAPVLVPAVGPAVTLLPLRLGQEGHGWSEAEVQALIQAHPACLPIAEIDPLFADPVPICTELNTTAGPIDNLMVTASGLPVLVECKLWSNPQARREVVGQILDYAKELSRWSSSDLQREVRRRLGQSGDPVLELVRAAGHAVDEIGFNDALTLNLRRGRFLLLIVGDGIREGVEAIAEYLQAHAGLHFTLGLVEVPIHAMPDGGRLVTPRVMARTALMRREVVAAPEGFVVREADEETGEEIAERSESPERRAGRVARRDTRQQFWAQFLAGLRLDDPEQPKPSPSLGGHVVFKFGAPGGSSWLTVYRDARSHAVGLFLSGNRASVGERAASFLARDVEALRAELGPEAIVRFDGERPDIGVRRAFANLEDGAERAEAVAWLQAETNRFINALRPRIQAALQDLGEM